MDALDALLILVAALLVLGGRRVGLLSGALALAASVVGATAAVAVLPHVFSGLLSGAVDPQVITIATLGSALVVAAGLGWIFTFSGRRLRSAIGGRRWHQADAALGAVAMGAVFLVTTASLAPLAKNAPLADAALSAALTAQVRDSQVVNAIHVALPAASTDLLSPYAALLAASSDGPSRLRDAARTAEPHVSAATTEHIVTTAAPAITPLGPEVTAAVLRDAASVVRILGDAPACGRTQEGSGFVVAPHRVMTNAHVVAGVRRPTVQVDGRGPRLPGRVVLFDPTLDVAILDVPDLAAPPLPLATAAQPPGTGAEAAGYPQNGPFRLAPAVVRSTIDDVTPARGTVGPSTQQVYQLAALIRPGNSGGPLITPTGQVIGVVFARSTQNRYVGYALTADQVAFAVTAASSLSQRVSTGRCSTTA
jgi:S1-C subfamily serine protease